MGNHYIVYATLPNGKVKPFAYTTKARAQRAANAYAQASGLGWCVSTGGMYLGGTYYAHPYTFAGTYTRLWVPRFACAVLALTRVPNAQRYFGLPYCTNWGSLPLNVPIG